mgnify:FL=1
MEEETKNKINNLLKSCNHRVIPSDDGTDISFRIWGDKGPVLLLLHGGYGSWLHWFNNIISLSEDFRLVIPDMPGFGTSEALPELPGLDKYAMTLVNGLAKLMPDEVYNIVGFSFGSAIGSHMVKFAGDRVNRLTLIGYNRTGNMPFIRPKMKSWRKVNNKEELYAAQRHNLSVMMIHKSDKIDDLAINLQTINTSGAKVRSLDIVASHDLPNRILDIQKPIDIIWGEFDVTLINGVEDARVRMTDIIPDVKCHIIHNAGHWIQFEEPEEFNKIIKGIYF